jgi:hypothetical protein
MMGLRELVVVALVAVVLYGRSGVVKSRQVQTILPWLSPKRRTGGQSGRTRSSHAASPRDRLGPGLFSCEETDCTGS